MKRIKLSEVLEMAWLGERYGNYGLNSTEDGEIVELGVVLARVRYGDYNDFLEISLQDFKTGAGRRETKIKLIKEANDTGLIVVFVPRLDIGFGVGDLGQSCSTTDLLKVMNYYKSDPYKNFAGVSVSGTTDYCDDAIMAYSFDQNIDYDHHKKSVVDILTAYYKMVNDDQETELHYEQRSTKWILAKRPDYEELEKLIRFGADCILYFMVSEPIDILEYIQLTNDIWSKMKLSTLEKPIIFDNIKDKRVDQWFEKAKNSFDKLNTVAWEEL